MQARNPNTPTLFTPQIQPMHNPLYLPTVINMQQVIHSLWIVCSLLWLGVLAASGWTGRGGKYGCHTSKSATPNNIGCNYYILQIFWLFSGRFSPISLSLF